MKKILISLFVIGVVSVASIGATRAYFSDSESVSGNTMATGTVTLGETWGMPFAIENLAPGETKSVDLAVRYTGSLVADLYVGAEEQWGYDLGPVLEYRLQRMDSGWNHNGWITGWTDFYGSDHIMAKWLRTHQNLTNEDWARTRLHIRMKTKDSDNVGGIGDWNDYQGKTESIWIHLYAVQAGTGYVPETAPRNY